MQGETLIATCTVDLWRLRNYLPRVVWREKGIVWIVVLKHLELTSSYHGVPPLGDGDNPTGLLNQLLPVLQLQHTET